MAFKALVLDEKDGRVSSSIRQLEDSDLPDGDVTVAVSHSTLNYKDGMILAGIGRLVRQYPHVPGVDFAGTVESSESSDFRPGDGVLLTGWRVGEAHWGGYAEKARVKAEWLVPLPDGLTAERAMAIGTAGFTAMQAVMVLERHGLEPGQGPVAVTGAAGGLGSIAVSILANLGYEVAASTGRTETHDYLKSLGASTIIDRAEIAGPPDRPMLKSRFAGAIDTVGGGTLATLVASMAYGASIAACGLAGGSDLDTSVIPFLLRGNNLLGIDSVMCPQPFRGEIWARLARDLPADKLDSVITRVRLEDLAGLAGKILKGQIRGRTVVELAN